MSVLGGPFENCTSMSNGCVRPLIQNWASQLACESGTMLPTVAPPAVSRQWHPQSPVRDRTQSTHRASD